MPTHTHSGNRRLALVSLYASLCSVLAVALAVQLAQTSSALSAAIDSQISALPGYYGIRESNLRKPSPIAGKKGDRDVKVLHSAARKINATRKFNARTRD